MPLQGFFKYNCFENLKLSQCFLNLSEVLETFTGVAYF